MTSQTQRKGVPSCNIRATQKNEKSKRLAGSRRELFQCPTCQGRKMRQEVASLERQMRDNAWWKSQRERLESAVSSTWGSVSKPVNDWSLPIANKARSRLFVAPLVQWRGCLFPPMVSGLNTLALVRGVSSLGLLLISTPQNLSFRPLG